MKATINQKAVSWRRLFVLALGLSLLLMVVSFIRIALSYDFVFQSNKVLDSVIDGPLLGTALGDAIVRFVIAQLFVYVGFAATVWTLARFTTYGWPKFAAEAKAVVLCWFLFLACAVFVANAYYNPWSTLGDYFADVVSVHIAGIPVAELIVWSIAALSALILIVAAAKFVVSLPTRPRSFAIGVALFASLIGVSSLLLRGEGADAKAQPHPLPHVIFIGVDSLRPDFTLLGGDEQHAPNVNAFLRNARAFSDVITPLARTFPSWMSILTGRHPHDTGAIMNLTRRDRIHASPTLAEILRSHGYRTVFAIDEVRFANIDASYGFDVVISPPMGAADFLLGAINDTPLSNLLAPTTLGKLLFPHSYSNRAAAHVYDPQDFVERLRSELDFAAPTFLAVHFTLPHYPYYWSDAPRHRENGAAHKGQSLYAETIMRADQQVGELFDILRERNVLDNALVVLLSDHGEGLGSNDDVLLTEATKEVDGFEIPALASGHGTSVLSPPQYQVLLAVQGFGSAPLEGLPRSTFDAPATLQDIAPTVLDLLGLPASDVPMTGKSLAPILRAEVTDRPTDRIRFTETEFNPPALLAGFDAERVLAQQSAKFYGVDATTGLLALREETLREAMAERQYAALNKKYVLAALPSGFTQGNDQEEPYRYVLVARDRSHVRLIVGRDDLTDDLDALRLWDALQERFHPELLRSGANGRLSRASDEN